MKNSATMNRREKLETVILYAVLVCYIILLCKILFFSRISFSELFNSQRDIERSINLIPFYSIGGFLFSSSDTVRSFSFGNVVGNIMIFAPIGAYLALFKKDKKTLTNLLFVFIASLLTETIQGLFAIGTADIDDIILNCLGGLAGILGYKLLVLVFKGEERARTVVTVLSVIVGLPVIFYFLFVIRMVF